MVYPLTVLRSLGDVVWAAVVSLWRMAEFSSRVLLAMVHFLWRQGFVAVFRITTQQVYFTGIEAMPFLSLLALLLGSTVIMQSLPQLQGVGAHALIGKILVISIVRELGPLIAAMLVIARSGTAMATQLATNRVLGEVEALESMGIDVIHFLVVPRVVGCMVSLFALIFFFDSIALVGGFLVASASLTIPLSLYLDYIFDSLRPLDLYISLCKSILFGMVVAIVSCYHGLRAQRAVFEVPMVARSGVVQSMFLVFLTSALLSALFYWL